MAEAETDPEFVDPVFEAELNVEQSYESEMGTRFLMLVAGGTLTFTSNDADEVFIDVVLGQRKITLQMSQREAMTAIEFLAVAARPGAGARIVASAADVTAALTAGSAPPVPTRAESVDVIQRVVCAHFGLRMVELRSHAKHKMIAGPRMIAMYLCRQRLGISYSQLGRAFGGRDHSTAMNAVSRVTAKLKEGDPYLRDHVGAIACALEESLLR